MLYPSDSQVESCTINFEHNSITPSQGQCDPNNNLLECFHDISEKLYQSYHEGITQDQVIKLLEIGNYLQKDLIAIMKKAHIFSEKAPSSFCKLCDHLIESFSGIKNQDFDGYYEVIVEANRALLMSENAFYNKEKNEKVLDQFIDLVEDFPDPETISTNDYKEQIKRYIKDINLCICVPRQSA